MSHHDTMRDAVLSRLDHLDRTAGGDSDPLLQLARTEINRLADSWRELLTVHRRDDHNRCLVCPPGRRSRRWPCRIWRMAYKQLLGESPPHRRRTKPLHRL
jgi:hypothetical protein